MEYDSEYEGGLKSEYGIRPIWGSKVNTGIRIHKLGPGTIATPPENFSRGPLHTLDRGRALSAVCSRRSQRGAVPRRLSGANLSWGRTKPPKNVIAIR